MNKFLVLSVMLMTGIFARAADPKNEIYCKIRDSGLNLNCQWITKDGRKAMEPDDLAIFVDMAS
ncbi:MAG: hypothetical protein H7235_01065, partial [Bdellovibrionaceae bacterium]|nr:hypothetical protein [Pseudobdellovibrionaceae bacterium]